MDGAVAVDNAETHLQLEVAQLDSQLYDVLHASLLVLVDRKVGEVGIHFQSVRCHLPLRIRQEADRVGFRTPHVSPVFFEVF